MIFVLWKADFCFVKTFYIFTFTDKKKSPPHKTKSKQQEQKPSKPTRMTKINYLLPSSLAPYLSIKWSVEWSNPTNDSFPYKPQNTVCCCFFGRTSRSVSFERASLLTGLLTSLTHIFFASLWEKEARFKDQLLL